jgi:hypothetical protein
MLGHSIAPFLIIHFSFIMVISKIHQDLATSTSSAILECPEGFLGPNWKDVLNFWIYLDTLSDGDFRLIGERCWDLDVDAIVSASNNVFKAAEATIGNDYADAACEVAPTGASAYATLELIGSHNLESFKFLPLFLNP